MADAAFSGDGKYYAALTHDGRLRVWDTETNVLKQEYTPDLHLTSPPSCLQWINITRSVSPQKGVRRKSVSEQETQVIVLGTTSGKILLYSIVQGKVETILTDQKSSEIHNNKVKCLDWHRKYGLYSCTSDNVVHEWDLQSASVRHKYNINVDNKSKQTSGVSAIKIIPHNEKSSSKYIIAASWQLRIWRFQEGHASLVKNLGHNAAPRALLVLASSGNTCWLIEGSQNERLLSFWDVTVTEEAPLMNGDQPTPNKRQRKKSIGSAPLVPTPTYNFVLEDAPRIIDVNVEKDESGSKIQLSAATRSGVVHFYSHLLNGSSTKPIKPSVTVQVTTADATPLPLQCCKLTTTGDMLLGYMNSTALMFERVTPDMNTKTQVLIRGDKKESKKKVKQTNEVNKVRSDQKNDEVTYVEPMGGVTRKRTTPGGQVEVSMEARLANLALDVKSRGRSAVNQNYTKLLMQGLHSKDKGIILTVLQNDDATVAARTVSGLPADYVPLLLDQLADMATRKTSQCAAVCTWLGATLRTHAALLLAAPPARLTQLLAILTHRRSHLCQLLNLKGRLELACAQRGPDTHLEAEPVLQYDDTSSEEEMEAEQYESDESAHSWDGADSGGGASESGDSD
ncbi:WD repeat-containing protein 43 [Battus philenor]|uniref:WD repeat-containing protein 43 n=1 Tax=Battus philenor TaxID=42288 RepID=UPI0035CFEFB5